MRQEMTLRQIRMAPPTSRARVDTSPMQPPMLPRNISAREVSGRVGITILCRGVAAVTTSAAEENRGSSAPTGA